ncbi:MAG: hypothetical protein ABIT47_02460 [Candidatus Paceibacterota bacterium]
MLSHTSGLYAIHSTISRLLTGTALATPIFVRDTWYTNVQGASLIERNSCSIRYQELLMPRR